MKFNPISAVRPMILFVEVDPVTVFPGNPQAQANFLQTDLVPLCLKHQIDGIVLPQDHFNENQQALLKAIQSTDTASKLTIVSRGSQIESG